MAAQSLVLCQDSQVLSVLQPVLAELDIGVSICTDVFAAEAMLLVRSFDAIIVDWKEIEGSPQMLQKARRASAKVELALALVGTLEEMQQAFRAGANLVLWKPVTAEDAARVLRTARGLVSGARRHFSRVMVDRLAYLNLEGMRDDAMIISVSEGGLGIQGLDPLQTGHRVKFRFALPGTSDEVAGTGEITWADDSGRAGIRFVDLRRSARAAVKDWIDHQMVAFDGAVVPPDMPGPARPNVVQRGLAILLDLVLLGGATSLFGLLFYLTTRTLPENSTILLAADVLFSLLWLVYRLVFFRNPAETPGALLAADFCNWHAAPLRLPASVGTVEGK